MKLGRKRSKAQRQSDFNKLADLYVRGVTQVEISRTLGISQGQVSNDIKKLLQVWQQDRTDKIDQLRNEQLHRINTMEAELWKSWEMSKTAPKVATVKSKSGEFVEKKTPASILGRKSKDIEEKDNYWRAGMTEELPTGAGDMQYMSGIQWCISERNKLTGLYAPTKIAKTNPKGDKEAGLSAKEEMMTLIGRIVDKGDGSKKAIDEGEDDYIEGEEVLDDEMPQLAKLLVERNLEEPESEEEDE